MVALNDLKRDDLVTSPWYSGKKLEFRVDGGDLTFKIDGGGTQRRINISVLTAMYPGMLIHTLPKKGEASLLVVKTLVILPPQEGEEKLGETLTFKGEKPCRATTEARQIQWHRDSIMQRLYRAAGNRILLAEQFLPRNREERSSTSYYLAIEVKEKDLLRK